MDDLGEALGCLLVLVIIGLGLWALSGLAGGLMPMLTEAMDWLASYWPGRESSAPCFAMVVVFAAQRLALFPWRLSHSRVDRRKGRVRPTAFARADDPDLIKGDNLMALGPRFWGWIALGVADCVLLFLVLAAMGRHAADGSASRTGWAIAWLIGTDVALLLLSLFARGWTCPILAGITGTGPATPDTFRGYHVHAMAEPMLEPATTIGLIVAFRQLSSWILYTSCFLVIAVVQ